MLRTIAKTSELDFRELQHGGVCYFCMKCTLTGNDECVGTQIEDAVSHLERHAQEGNDAEVDSAIAQMKEELRLSVIGNERIQGRRSGLL